MTVRSARRVRRGSRTQQSEDDSKECQKSEERIKDTGV